MRTLEIILERSFRRRQTRKGRGREVSICQSILVPLVKEFNTVVAFSLPNPFLDIFFSFFHTVGKKFMWVLNHWTRCSLHHQSWICTRTFPSLLYLSFDNHRECLIFSFLVHLAVSCLHTEFLKWVSVQQVKLNLFRQTRRQSRQCDTS